VSTLVELVAVSVTAEVVNSNAVEDDALSKIVDNSDMMVNDVEISPVLVTDGDDVNNTVVENVTDVNTNDSDDDMYVKVVDGVTGTDAVEDESHVD
jgi:hypothetical protein